MNFCRFYNKIKKPIYNYWESACDGHEPYVPVNKVNIIAGLLELIILMVFSIIGKAVLFLFFLIVKIVEKTNSSCDSQENDK